MTSRCYTREQVLELLHMSKSTFFKLRAEGKLPFLEELRPRLGRVARYRASLVDRYLENEWGARTLRVVGGSRR